MENARRSFIKKAATGTAIASFGGILPHFSPKSYGSILGANDRILIASMGVNGRGHALAKSFSSQANCEMLYVSDVDSRASDKCIASVASIQKKKPNAAPDFRKALEDKNLDALVVATPDHWHAPAAILACKAGKNVYLEKPASHNPNEGEILVAASAKHKRIVQMGNQFRSSPNIKAAIRELHDGVIGRPFFAKTWYTNNRGPIGTGKKTAVPSWLDFELWQGPAPRQSYRDNILHYRWHWFWDWGTGEALNNGVHMVDLARWGLGVDYPQRVASIGGRYRYQDDWQTPDTQVITLEFGNKTSIMWEGRSCNSNNVEGSSVGIIFYGDNGALKIVENDFTIYDLENNIVKEVKDEAVVQSRNLTNPAQDLDGLHIQNFLAAIRNGTSLNSDIVNGHKSTLLCQLGNIAQRSGQTLNINPENGHIINDRKAMKYWGREYQPGWEPKIQ